jgi:hypothetical protein
LGENGGLMFLSIHPGATKMYQDLKRLFWWLGMKKEIAEFVYACLVCQTSKIEHQRSSAKPNKHTQILRSLSSFQATKTTSSNPDTS